jgi:hypothetical protein
MTFKPGAIGAVSTIVLATAAGAALGVALTRVRQPEREVE